MEGIGVVSKRIIVVLLCALMVMPFYTCWAGEYLLNVSYGKREETQIKVYDALNPSYYEYRNGRFGFSIQFPKNYKYIMIPVNGDGIYVGLTNGTIINASASYDNNEDSLVTEYAAQKERLKYHLKYSRLSATYYVLSWVDGDRIIKYEKTFRAGGKRSSFDIVYPEFQKETVNSIVEHIEQTFKPST